MIEMRVVGDHMHRSGSGKGLLLLSARLAIGRLDATRGIGIAAGAFHFNKGRAQFSVGIPDARVS